MGQAADDPVSLALLVGRCIEVAGGRYFVGGSLASSLQGEPRASNDIDIILDLPIGRIASFVENLGGDFEVDTDMLRDAILNGRSCNIFHLPSVMKIDLFGVGRTPYDEAEFSRRRTIEVRATGETLVVKSPEDTVLRKLLWYREGGHVSERQWRDVVEVLRVSGAEMNREYLDSWAARLGVSDLLTRAIAEAGGP